MNRRLLPFVLGALVATGCTVWILGGSDAIDSARKIAELQQTVTTARESLFAYERYKDYLSAGRKTLGSRTKLITANVSRDYTANRYVERSILGVKFHGAVVVNYTVDYSFGYELAPASYDVVDGPSGLEIRIGRPSLVAPPAIRNLHYQVMDSGWLTDEKAAALDLYEGASKAAAEDGGRMQSAPEVVALCEKGLIAFLHDFLAKQPGVQRVPNIVVVYPGSRPDGLRPRSTG